jgi:broad specificity phosphatase PhoE
MSEKKLVAIFQRHGSTILNEDNKFRSRLDPPLDAKGLKQAEDAAENLKELGIEVKRVVCSPLLRAVQTGDAIAELYGLEVEQDRAITSWALGLLQGKDKDEYADILNLYVENPKKAIPDGESLDDFEARNFEYLDKELRKDSKLTAFCTHNSNCVALNKFIDEDFSGKAESDEMSVKPGGTLAVYVDGSGKYSVDIIFGKEKSAEFGT